MHVAPSVGISAVRAADQPHRQFRQVAALCQQCEWKQQDERGSETANQQRSSCAYGLFCLVQFSAFEQRRHHVAVGMHCRGRTPDGRRRLNRFATQHDRDFVMAKHELSVGKIAERRNRAERARFARKRDMLQSRLAAGLEASAEIVEPLESELPARALAR